MARAAVFGALLLAWPAAAAVPPDVPQRIVLPVTVYGDTPCPKSADGEIVVCAKEPLEEGFRIPKSVRPAPVDKSPPGKSWPSLVRSAEAETRFTRPGSCSPVGVYGQTGCSLIWLQDWAEERRELKREAEARAEAEKRAEDGAAADDPGGSD